MQGKLTMGRWRAGRGGTVLLLGILLGVVGVSLSLRSTPLLGLNVGSATYGVAGAVLALKRRRVVDWQRVGWLPAGIAGVAFAVLSSTAVVVWILAPITSMASWVLGTGCVTSFGAARRWRSKQGLKDRTAGGSQ